MWKIWWGITEHHIAGRRRAKQSREHWFQVPCCSFNIKLLIIFNFSHFQTVFRWYLNRFVSPTEKSELYLFTASISSSLLRLSDIEYWWIKCWFMQFIREKADSARVVSCRTVMLLAGNEYLLQINDQSPVDSDAPASLCLHMLMSVHICQHVRSAEGVAREQIINFNLM